MARKWIITILLILPMIGMAIPPLVQQAKIWTTPDPQKTISSNVVGATGCHDLPLIGNYNVEPADDLDDTVKISAEEGRNTADRTIAAHRGWFFLQIGIYGSRERLVHITLPNDEERLAWTRVLVWDDGGITLQGKADIAYVDANTGDPLLLITDVTVGDPAFTCGMVLDNHIDDVSTAILSLIALAIYAALVLLGSIVYLFARQARKRRAEEAAG